MTKTTAALTRPAPFHTVWKSFCSTLGLSRAHSGGAVPLIPSLPSNAGRGGHKTCPHSSPLASGDAMATRRKKLCPLRHSTHALASIVKRLKSSHSLFFSAEITARALKWNLPPFISSIFTFVLFPPTTCSLPTLKHPLRGCGGKCEALIKPWLLFFKGLAPS